MDAAVRLASDLERTPSAARWRHFNRKGWQVVDESQLGINKSILDAFVHQQEINTSLSRGFTALALMSDKYDAEIEELREGLAALDYRLKIVEHGGESVSAKSRVVLAVPDDGDGA